MDLTKKTTILFSPELHRRLTDLAARRDVSLGELVREACEAQYGLGGTTTRREAAAGIASFSLPVDDPAHMKAESVTAPEDLLP